MSDRLRQSLMSSRSEIVAGLAEAEAELSRVRQRAAELEELIALGTATLLAAEMISGGAKGAPETGTAEAAPEVPHAPEAARGPESVPQATATDEADEAEMEPDPHDEPAAGPTPGATYEDDLRALLERAQP